jgi:glycosyltransferase involved in cell wall biosynthesis
MVAAAHAGAAAPLLASVVVPVRNDRGRYLRALLEALDAQTIGRGQFEILIGDDGSSDGSTHGLETTDGRLRVLRGAPQNSYAARNRAARAGSAPVIAFVDSDCRPEPTWLEEGLRALQFADAAAGGISFTVPERPTVWTLVDMETTKDHERQVRVANAETANLFVHRELFDRIGGFDDTLPEHGDFDFAERIVAAGGRLVYAPTARVVHPTRDTPKPFLRMVWVMNRWYAVRAVRDGRRPAAVKLRCWFPLVSTVRGRRRFGYSLRLDRRALAANGVRPRLRHDLLALPIQYLLLPYLRNAAQLVGWVEGKRLR